MEKLSWLQLLTLETKKIEQINEYLQEQGISLKVPVVYQNNMSTVTLISEENSGNMRTRRHLSARRAIVFEELKKMRSAAVVKYLPTASMIADVLTKTLGGSLFFL